MTKDEVYSDTHLTRGQRFCEARAARKEVGRDLRGRDDAHAVPPQEIGEATQRRRLGGADAADEGHTAGIGQTQTVRVRRWVGVVFLLRVVDLDAALVGFPHAWCWHSFRHGAALHVL
jgi:hypothetical protein